MNQKLIMEINSRTWVCNTVMWWTCAFALWDCNM